MRRLIPAVAACLSLLLSPAIAQEPQYVFVPSVDVEQARQSVQEFAKQRKPGDTPSFFVTKRGLSAASERTYVDWQWEDQGI